MKRTLLTALTLGIVGAANASVLWDNGGYHDYFNDISGGLPGAYANIGFSSGAISGASTHRWFAQPFDVVGGSATIEKVNVSWFAPAGSEPLGIKLKVWPRTALTTPPTGTPISDVDVVATGAIGSQVPDPRYPFTLASSQYTSATLPVPVGLAAGSYWLVLHGNGIDPDANLSGFGNAAIFGNAPGSLSAYNSPTGDGRGWRSAVYPTPGFAAYGPATLIGNRPADPLDWRWNMDYSLEGTGVGICKPISGKITLQGVALDGNAATGFVFYARIQLRNASDVVIAERSSWIGMTGDQATPEGNWAITAPAGNDGPFTVSIKVDGYLRKNLTGVAAGASGLNAGTVSCADADDDNSITVFDYGILSDYFDRTSADADFFDPFVDGMQSPFMADFDSDGAVTVFDYGYLSDNFDQSGDA